MDDFFHVFYGDHRIELGEITAFCQRHLLEVLSYLRVESCRRGSSRAAESNIRPESPGLL